MADQGVAILLLIALMLGGAIILLNPIPELGIGFKDIVSVQSFIWIIAVKIIAIALIIIPGWIIYQMIKG